MIVTLFAPLGRGGRTTVAAYRFADTVLAKGTAHKINAAHAHAAPSAILCELKA
jgi:hypothetical protein